MNADGRRSNLSPKRKRAGPGGAIVAVSVAALIAALPHAAAGEPGKPAALPAAWYFDDQHKVRRLEGLPAPELNIREWRGAPQKLSELRGQIVVLDLWAAWCAPCIHALNIDARIVRKYADRGVTLIGVHDPKRGWDLARQIADTRQIQYSVGLDSADEQEGTCVRYGLEAWPTYVVIDRRGIVRAAGLKPDYVEDVIELLLKEPASPGDARRVAFPPEVYLGGASGAPIYRDIEGRIVPALAVERWLGEPQDPALSGGGVTVLLFGSFNALTVRELEALRAIEPELVKRGARLIALCNRRADWSEVECLAAEREWRTVIARDAAAVAENGAAVYPAAAGATAVAFGVRIAPTIVVVDGDGVVRAAGIRADKVLHVLDAISGGQPDEAAAAVDLGND